LSSSLLHGGFFCGAYGCFFRNPAEKTAANRNLNEQNSPSDAKPEGI
jgi:hypothetical protein